MNFDIKFDFQRRDRLGLIEAIWGQDKSIDQLERLCGNVLSKNEVVFITRSNREKANYLLDLYGDARFYEEANCLTIGKNFKKKIQRFCLLLICLVVLIFQSDIPNLKALTMDNFQSEMVIEELRLKVSADVKAAWLNAEKEIWEPWLSSQDGFLGRQLFWDKEKEEALILVNWKSKKLWKSIPISEVNVVQQKFEDNVKAALNIGDNPFELIYEGELDKQT